MFKNFKISLNLDKLILYGLILFLFLTVTFQNKALTSISSEFSDISTTYDYKVVKRVSFKTIIKEVEKEVVKEAEIVYVYKTKILPVYVDKEFKLSIVQNGRKVYARAMVGDTLIQQQELCLYFKPDLPDLFMDIGIGYPLVLILGLEYMNFKLGTIITKDQASIYAGISIKLL